MFFLIKNTCKNISVLCFTIKDVCSSLVLHLQMNRSENINIVMIGIIFMC